MPGVFVFLTVLVDVQRHHHAEIVNCSPEPANAVRPNGPPSVHTNRNVQAQQKRSKAVQERHHTPECFRVAFVIFDLCNWLKYGSKENQPAYGDQKEYAEKQSFGVERGGGIENSVNHTPEEEALRLIVHHLTITEFDPPNNFNSF